MVVKYSLADFFFAGGVPVGAVEFEEYGGVGDCERGFDDDGVSRI